MVGRWDGLAGPRRKEERGGRDVGWAGKREERNFLTQTSFEQNSFENKLNLNFGCYNILP